MTSTWMRLWKLAKQASPLLRERLTAPGGHCCLNELDEIKAAIRAEDLLAGHDTLPELKENNFISWRERYAGQVPPVADVVLKADDEVMLIAFYMRGAHDRHAVMPLHDHPGMHGIIRVIQGRVRLHSYTIDRYEEGMLRGDAIATYHGETVLDSNSEPAVLHPREGNVHTLVPADNEPCGFLDVLIPNYKTTNGRTDINYYNVEGIVEADNQVRLSRLPAEPLTYWTHAISFNG